MSNLINLAHTQINGGDVVTIQLLRVDDLPAAVGTAQQVSDGMGQDVSMRKSGIELSGMS